jgi:hypothetical protein
MRKQPPQRDIRRREPQRRTIEQDGSSVVDAIISKPIPSQARVLFAGLASAAIESAVSDDSEAVLVGFSLLRQTFRDLEAIFEQMGGASGVNNRPLRKGPAKDITTQTQQNRAPRRTG